MYIWRDFVIIGERGGGVLSVKCQAFATSLVVGIICWSLCRHGVIVESILIEIRPRAMLIYYILTGLVVFDIELRVMHTNQVVFCNSCKNAT